MRFIKKNKLASSVNAIAISEIWNFQSLTDSLTDRGRCKEMLSHLKMSCSSASVWPAGCSCRWPCGARLESLWRASRPSPTSCSGFPSCCLAPPRAAAIYLSKVYSVVVSDMLIIRFCSNLQNSFQLVQLALKLSVVLLQNHLKNNSAFNNCPRKT